jgi:ATP-dependent protease ClpP protease subunit
MAEVLLYGSIYSRSASDFITQVNEIEDGELTVRVNCEGGEVMYGWGIITKIKEFAGKKLVKVDGQAHSMAGFALLYTDDSEAVDVSQFVIHRAAYWAFYESDYMTDNERFGLVSMNKSLESAFRAKIDVEKFEKIAGFTVSEMFSLEDRKEVTLTAQQAKSIGLIKRIVKITPEKQNEVNAHVQRVAAQHTGISEFRISKIVAENEPIIEANITNQNPKKMNKSELQAQHPALFAEIFGEGVTAGIEKEKVRVGAWSPFLKIDAEKAQAGIDSGKEVTAADISEFTVKAMTNGALNTLKEEGQNNAGANASTTSVEETNVTAEQKSVEAFAAKMNAAAGISATPKA